MKDNFTCLSFRPMDNTKSRPIRLNECPVQSCFPLPSASELDFVKSVAELFFCSCPWLVLKIWYAKSTSPTSFFTFLYHAVLARILVSRKRRVYSLQQLRQIITDHIARHLHNREGRIPRLLDMPDAQNLLILLLQRLKQVIRARRL
jgi:hypothetical protein